MCKSREEGEPSFSRLPNGSLVKVETRPRLAQLADGKLKEGKSMKFMVTISDSRRDKQCMQNMNWRFNKQIKMHVGEVVRWLGERQCKIVSCMRQQ